MSMYESENKSLTMTVWLYGVHVWSGSSLCCALVSYTVLERERVMYLYTGTEEALFAFLQLLLWFNKA